MQSCRTSFYALSAMLFVMAAALSPEALAQSAPPTSGQSLGQISANITDSLKGVQVLAEAIAYVGGFFMGLGALFKLKAYKDNPQQTPLSTPITWLVIAVLLIALPSVFGSGFTTVFGGNAQTVQPW